MDESEIVVVTLREIAEAHGIGIEGARMKAKRRDKAGRWRILPTNHPLDPVRVEMPREDLHVEPVGRRSTEVEGAPINPNAGREEGTPREEANTSQRIDPNGLEALVDVVSELSSRVAELTERLLGAEKGRAAAERDAAVLQAEIAGVRYALDTATAQLIHAQERHFGELATIRAEHADELARVTDAGRVEADRMKAELDAWKARPWWKRIAG